ncbi:MAG: alpha/beta hydrolase [Sandarakinorhabdus sp.]|nr:alpha/beta hydrolase [Sandarakinorhabdus sp.]
MQRIEIETPRARHAALLWDSAPAGSPWLHFAHATGMHAGLYARLLAPLADRFRIVASDARGHGRTAAIDPRPPEGDLVEWEVFGADTLAITAAIDASAPWILAGHSMGGSASLLAATMAPDRVAGLVLVDPPMIPFAIARAAEAAGVLTPNPMADGASRRRATYPDTASARERWHGRGVFSGWDDADLDAYLADGLRTVPDGVTLACTPAWEAATFRGVSHRIEAAMAALKRPFALVAGDIGSTVRADEFAIFAAHPFCVGAERLPGTTHFVPLQRGDAVRAAVVRVAAG